MKLSVSVTPQAFYQHGCERIIDLGFATEAQLKKKVSAGWSKYIQTLIQKEMEKEGKWPPGIRKATARAKGERQNTPGN